MTILLSARELAKAYGPHQLFSSIELAIDDGERVGLIGPNGSGKSTLFGILAGDIEPDHGTMEFRRHCRVAYLCQNPTFAIGATPQDVVASALAELHAAHEAYHRCSEALSLPDADHGKLLRDQSNAATEIERLGGWNWQHGVDAMLDRLSIDRSNLHAPVATLSGGQQRRVALARVLLMRPDLLLLDEPTNHLDTDTIEWFEDFLRNWPGAILMVTHDRYFLDRVVTRIVELEPEALLSYPGNYASFMARKIELLQQREQQAERHAKTLERELAWLRRGPKARTTKAQFRVKRAHALMEEAPTKAQQNLELQFHTNDRLGGIVLEATGLHKRYQDQQVLRGVSLNLRKEDKVALVGPNGCGKSTLIRLLVQEESADAGAIRLGKNSHLAYLSQDRSGLDPDATVYEALDPNDRVQVGEQSHHKRGFLQRFLFSYQDQNKKVRSLSGGETCRLLLAKLMCTNANLLILDEPTNDLDILSLQVLENALIDFSGTLLLVTHDRYFINRVCNAVLAFEQDELIRYDGDYDFYRDCVETAQAASKQNTPPPKRTPPAPVASQEGPRRLTYKERLELAGIEGEIEAAEAQRDAITARLSDPAVYQSDPSLLRTLAQDLEQAESRVEALYARWQLLDALRQDAEGP